MFRRPVIALPSLFFGRGRRYLLEAEIPASMADDTRLFALTFVGGFLFMTVYLA
ncbi:MAG: hypothetical protein ABIP07_07255 [Sphingomicrobium sp.]